MELLQFEHLKTLVDPADEGGNSSEGSWEATLAAISMSEGGHTNLDENNKFY